MFTKMHIMCNVEAARKLTPSKRLVPEMLDIAAFIISDIVRTPSTSALSKASQILARWRTLVFQSSPKICRGS
jgi:hypothetical protein